MSHLETPDELADHLADLLGIYGDPRCVSVRRDWERLYGLDSNQEPRHFWQESMYSGRECNCRVFWVPRTTERIRLSVRHEEELALVVRSAMSR